MQLGANARSFLAAILSTVLISSPVQARAPSLGLGAYVGNNPADLAQFEGWLGRPVDHIVAHTGRANWKDWLGSIKWSLDRWTPANKPIAWTIPLFVDGGSLADASAGRYDDYYRQGARVLAASRPADEVIYVRTGEELNGNWMPWAAAGHEQEFVLAYRHFVDAFRSASSRFRFEWNVNMGETRMDAAKAYPGDGYVDVIGMDFYYNISWNPADPAAAWNEMVSRPYGLQWLEQFAAEHHKPTAYPEWGVNSDGAGRYIELAADWFAKHNVEYQDVWNSNAAFPGKLSDGQYPHAAATYISLFGRNPAQRRAAQPDK